MKPIESQTVNRGLNVFGIVRCSLTYNGLILLNANRLSVAVYRSYSMSFFILMPFCNFFVCCSLVSSSFKTFWLTLKPSSVIRMLDVVTRDLKLQIMLREPHARDDKECFCESFKLKACQTFIDIWDDDVVIPSIRIFHRHPSFKESC